jgi:glycosyltransferase involved in cell wall biosynthesis
MKLIIISDAWHPQVNGVVRTYEYLSEELIKQGHEIKVIGPSDFPHTIPTPGYKEIRLTLFPSRRLKNIIEDFAPDAIHIATEGPLGWAARKYCLRKDRAFTTSYHTHFPDYVAKRFAKFLPFLYKPIHTMAKAHIRRFHAKSAAMMIATKSLADQLKSWGFKRKIYPLTRGVKLDQFYPGEKTLFQDLPKPIAIYVGRVAIEKNIEDFLNMPWDGSKIVVGDGPSREELSAQYPDAIFVGNKTGEELAAHYRSADLFVFPSRTDTFGIVIIEALASGLPVAAYNVTGPVDIITEDFLGAMHENDLSIAAKKALSNGTPEKRAAYVKKFYTWDYAAKQFETAVTETLTFSNRRKRRLRLRRQRS